MFERYTEKARRVIFFARYEASQFGSPDIETEHLLLGVLREGKDLANRFLKSHASVESIRKQIEEHTAIREKIATSVDLPLSNESKRVLAYAAEEAERLANKNIGSEHLFLGLLREEKSFAAEILKERGVILATAREEIARLAQEPPPAQRPPGTPPQSSDLFRNLTQSAADGQLEPVVRREREIDALIEILCCRQRNSAILVGERGAGKTAIIEGLAQRIADGAIQSPLAEKRVMAIETAQAAAWAGGKPSLAELTATETARLGDRPADAIVVFDDLRDILAAAGKAGSVIAARTLRQTLLRGEIQCIASCTPEEYRELEETAAGLLECFRAVHVKLLDEEATLDVLRARKSNLEKFHEVTYAEDALEAAVRSAVSYLPGSPLPGKALDLLDAAGARVKLRQGALPEEVVEIQKRIRFIAHRMDSAVQNHEFEKARFYSDEERKERENLRAVRERHHLDETSSLLVSRKDMEEIVASLGTPPFRTPNS